MRMINGRITFRVFVPSTKNLGKYFLIFIIDKTANKFFAVILETVPEYGVCEIAIHFERAKIIRFVNG
jgi:hypothetical protein